MVKIKFCGTVSVMYMILHYTNTNHILLKLIWQFRKKFKTPLLQFLDTKSCDYDFLLSMYLKARNFSLVEMCYWRQIGLNILLQLVFICGTSSQSAYLI